MAHAFACQLALIAFATAAAQGVVSGAAFDPTLKTALLAVAKEIKGTEIEPLRLAQWLRRHRDQRIGGHAIRRSEKKTNAGWLWWVV